MHHPQPTNPTLYRRVKSMADAKFLAKTSAYKSAWIVREYKKRGGQYRGPPSHVHGLPQWFNEKWVDLARSIRGKYAPCGRKRATMNTPGPYPYCRPLRRVNKHTPKTVGQLSPKTIKNRIRRKQNISFTSILKNKNGR